MMHIQYFVLCLSAYSHSFVLFFACVIVSDSIIIVVGF